MLKTGKARHVSLFGRWFEKNTASFELSAEIELEISEQYDLWNGEEPKRERKSSHVRIPVLQRRRSRLGPKFGIWMNVFSSIVIDLIDCGKVLIRIAEELKM